MISLSGGGSNCYHPLFSFLEKARFLNFLFASFDFEGLNLRCTLDWRKKIAGLDRCPNQRRLEMFRELSAEEELSFREWAHENFKIDQEPNELWHPVIRWEWAKIKTDRLNAIQRTLDKGE